jgi:hypothetical protein
VTVVKIMKVVKVGDENGDKSERFGIFSSSLLNPSQMTIF